MDELEVAQGMAKRFTLDTMKRAKETTLDEKVTTIDQVEESERLIRIIDKAIEIKRKEQH